LQNVNTSINRKYEDIEEEEEKKFIQIDILIRDFEGFFFSFKSTYFSKIHKQTRALACFEAK
jgi:hypothetical protein